MTFSAVEAEWTRALASHTGIFHRLTSIEFTFAMAPTVHWIARRCFRFLANAFEGAVLTEEPIIAFLLACLACESGATIAFTVDWAATTVVETITSASAAFAKCIHLTRSFAFESIPACLAKALATLRIAFRSVFTIAALRAILAVGSSWAIILTLVTGKTLKNKRKFLSSI